MKKLTCSLQAALTGSLLLLVGEIILVQLLLLLLGSLEGLDLAAYEMVSGVLGASGNAANLLCLRHPF